MSEPLRAADADHGASIRMTADRILLRPPQGDSERKTKGGLVIPATAASESQRCIWAEVVAVGPHVRDIASGDQVLMLPESRMEAQIRGEDYYLVRERDVHAVASGRTDAGTGLYL